MSVPMGPVCGRALTTCSMNGARSPLSATWKELLEGPRLEVVHEHAQQRRFRDRGAQLLLRHDRAQVVVRRLRAARIAFGRGLGSVTFGFMGPMIRSVPSKG